MTVIPDVFPEIPAPKTWLDKCLKSHLSEDPQTENMANRSKRYSNLNNGTFTKFINHCEGSCIEKSHF